MLLMQRSQYSPATGRVTKKKKRKREKLSRVIVGMCIVSLEKSYS
jgi:hypothetical protein